MVKIKTTKLIEVGHIPLGVRKGEKTMVSKLWKTEKKYKTFDEASSHRNRLLEEGVKAKVRRRVTRQGDIWFDVKVLAKVKEKE